MGLPVLHMVFIFCKRVKLLMNLKLCCDGPTLKVLSLQSGVGDLHRRISLTERSDFSDLVGSLVACPSFHPPHFHPPPQQNAEI